MLPLTPSEGQSNRTSPRTRPSSLMSQKGHAHATRLDGRQAGAVKLNYRVRDSQAEARRNTEGPWSCSRSGLESACTTEDRADGMRHCRTSGRMAECLQTVYTCGRHRLVNCFTRHYSTPWLACQVPEGGFWHRLQRGFGERKCQGKGGTAVHHALYLNLTAIPLHQVPDNRQAQPGT